MMNDYCNIRVILIEISINAVINNSDYTIKRVIYKTESSGTRFAHYVMKRYITGEKKYIYITRRKEMIAYHFL